MSRGFLLDTNVPSELTRPQPDPRVAQWLEETDDDLMYLSVITIGEVRLHCSCEWERENGDRDGAPCWTQPASFGRALHGSCSPKAVRGAGAGEATFQWLFHSSRGSLSLTAHPATEH
jgi:hypothetical protein